MFRVTRDQIQDALVGGIKNTRLIRAIDSVINSYSPWIYSKLNADFTTSSTIPVDIDGFAVVPELQAQYEITGQLYVRTSNAADAAKIGITWPTVADGIAIVRVNTVVTTGNDAASVLTPASTFPDAVNSYPCTLDIGLITETTATGQLKVQICSNAGATITIKKGSYLRWRLI